MAITQKYSIMCDDVRREDNGKMMLIGVYSPDITVPHVPVVLPSLAFYQVYEHDRPAQLAVRIRLSRMDTGASLQEGMGMMVVPKPGQGAAVFKLNNVPLPVFGTYSFAVQVEGEGSPFISTFDVILPPQAPSFQVPPFRQQ
jgi:hypothetical protein